MMANLQKRREVMVRKGTNEGKVDGQHAGNVRAREGWRLPLKTRRASKMRLFQMPAMLMRVCKGECFSHDCLNDKTIK